MMEGERKCVTGDMGVSVVCVVGIVEKSLVEMMGVVGVVVKGWVVMVLVVVQRMTAGVRWEMVLALV